MMMMMTMIMMVTMMMATMMSDNHGSDICRRLLRLCLETARGDGRHNAGGDDHDDEPDHDHDHDHDRDDDRDCDHDHAGDDFDLISLQPLLKARLAASPNKNASRTYITSPDGVDNEEFGYDYIYAFQMGMTRLIAIIACCHIEDKNCAVR